MLQVEKDKRVYELGREFLLSFDKVTEQVLDIQLKPEFQAIEERPKDLETIYFRLLGSAQNVQSSPKVIGGSIGGLENLKPILANFDVNGVIDKYGDNWELLFNTIKSELKPRGKIRDTPRSLWPRFCRAALSGAEFLSQFHSAKDFYGWMDFFDKDDKSRAALPLIIASEVEGIGFALACDFIKGLGYQKFGKPDVHVKKIFVGLGLCNYDEKSDYRVFKAITRVAASVNTTAFTVDKLFWLIGSGNFYNSGINIGRNREKFIQYVKTNLS